MRIGVAGLGKMGSALAERVIELGHEVAVWNRTAARAAPLVEKGAARMASPRALAERSETILVMVLDDAAQAAVYGGADGLLSGALAGKLVIDMSTVSPESSAARAAAVTAAGGHFLECPVGGTVTPARTGKLWGWPAAARTPSPPPSRCSTPCAAASSTSDPPAPVPP